MGWISEKNAILAFGLTFALLVINGVLSYRNTVLVAEKERRVAHTHEVLDALQTVLSTLADAEAGQRGYLITGQLRYLRLYDSARDRIQEETERLKILSADKPGLQQGIPSLEQQIAVAFNTMKQTIEVRKAEGSNAARWLALIDRGKMEMDDIRQLVAGMKQEENDRLRRRVELFKATTRTALGVVSTTTILGLAFVGLCFYLVNHNFRLRLQVENNYDGPTSASSWPHERSPASSTVLTLGGIFGVRRFPGQNLPALRKCPPQRRQDGDASIAQCAIFPMISEQNDGRRLARNLLNKASEKR